MFGVIFSLCSICSTAQKSSKPDQITDYIPTENVDFGKEANTPKNIPKEKVMNYIYVNNANGILYGNPCALEETRRMGFEYVLNPIGLRGSIQPDDQFSNNLNVKFKLVFTRSPFWKLILNRRIKQCREVSGDIVG